MTRLKAIFIPVLAGASLRDRLLACAGALLGVAFVGASCWLLLPASMPWIVAPIGASTVLLFAVPASPLAQPWAIIGGNSLSAMVGVATLFLLPDPLYAAPVAVAAAILLMSLCRCLHPPGGAAALSAILAPSLILADGGARFLVLVAINSALLVASGWLFHRLSGHSYPHRAVPAGQGEADASARTHISPSGLLIEDIDGALADLGETFDIGREDLAMLLTHAEARAERRRSTGAEQLDAGAAA
ncbi:HPP family protein [Sphingopyxis sp. MWB1]|uniref:HPP family protein n=1 Tax=Sphingopyxis sp. MWB1 TaxID=1537715 RepID=UPI000A455DFB|nr:HPP family protein [Sphingopyxis sp. MWB1]